MNWLIVGSVGGGVTVTRVESGGMTYSAAQKLADEINAMYAAQQNAHLTPLTVRQNVVCPECETLFAVEVSKNAAQVA